MLNMGLEIINNSTKPNFSTKLDLKILKSGLKCLAIPPQIPTLDSKVPYSKNTNWNVYNKSSSFSILFIKICLNLL